MFDSLRPGQTQDSCLGVKGSPVQIRPSRPKGPGQRGFRVRARALSDLREPTGESLDAGQCWAAFLNSWSRADPFWLAPRSTGTHSYHELTAPSGTWGTFYAPA